jgi:hypothetical protein
MFNRVNTVTQFMFLMGKDNQMPALTLELQSNTKFVTTLI